MVSLTSSRPTTPTHWHQDSPKPTMNEGTDDLQLLIDTRQTLNKRPPHTNQDGTKSPTRPLPAEGKRTKRPVYEGAYTSVIPQVNYTEGPTPNNQFTSLYRSGSCCIYAPPRISMMMSIKKKNFHGLSESWLRVGFLTPVRGTRGRWGGWPPDWGGWVGSPGPLRRHTSGLND
jgi:hypothetical protein